MATPEHLLRYAEVERKLSNSMLTKPDMQKVIEQILDLAYHSIMQEDYEAAAKMLTKLESTCDIVVNHGDEIAPNIVIFILHNLA
jgi:aminoglycoside phosphotransferase